MAGRKPGHGTDDTADSHGRLGIDCAVTHREITKRDGAGRTVTADHIVAVSMAGRWPGGGAGGGDGGSHGRRRRSPRSGPGRPPCGARGRDSLILSRATGSNLSRSHFISSRSSSNIPGRKTAPYGWIDGYLRRICNRGCRPGALSLLGLGLPGLLGRLQRRETFHQKPTAVIPPLTAVTNVSGRVWSDRSQRRVTGNG
jgi:hypothetical protein